MSGTTPNDDGMENSPQNTDGVVATAETTGGHVRLTTEDGTTITGRLEDRASVATTTDDDIDVQTGGFATGLDPAEVDGQPVDHVLLISIVVGSDSAPQFAQVYGDGLDDLRDVKVVDEIEVTDDE